MTQPLPSGYRSPHDPGRDSRLCARCGDPIHRLAEHVTPAWLDTLEAVDPEALRQFRAYAYQLATLWWWTHEALDGAAHGRGQADLRTYQRFGDPTAGRIRQPTDNAGDPIGEPQIDDTAALILRARSRREAKRIRDAAERLRKELHAFEIADKANLEAERQQWEQQQARRVS